MGTLVLDIETASPFEEPPENSNDTKYYELFAVSLAYADDIEGTPETEVLFRRGDWEDPHTIDLYQRCLSGVTSEISIASSLTTVPSSTGSTSSIGLKK